MATPLRSHCLHTHASALHASHAQTLEERETYLRQLEADQAAGVSNGVPSRQGVLAAPVACFVIKARSADGAKVFINVCTTDKARRCAECRPTTCKSFLVHSVWQSIQAGMMMSKASGISLRAQVEPCSTADSKWCVPTALGKKLRVGTDAAGQPCSVWDLSVHPNACDKALASAQHKVTAPAAVLACTPYFILHAFLL